ncbi:Hypothetical protein P9515_13081 [Prochlorococcus marinus str. MIT 9515]|uniref:Uncharacterized protein n=1 Tax=Prochlorococcus marinus (strain MIT 9515) TaxID=167542 RepID=A2BXK4_PROM5|nr:Hypothetical protein P9515_13081 [Prochlorococcus marinus str. MIT 9515]
MLIISIDKQVNMNSRNYKQSKKELKSWAEFILEEIKDRPEDYEDIDREEDF